MEKLKKERINTTIKGIRNLFRLEKENKEIKYIILRDIRNLFEHEEEENYSEPVAASNFGSNSYIECKSNGNKSKTQSAKEYLNRIRPYLKNIINNLKKIAINFIASMDNDEERVMNSKSDNTKIMMNEEADEVIKQLFDSLKNRYQNNLESMEVSDFVFNYIYLLYYNIHEIIVVEHI